MWLRLSDRTIPVGIDISGCGLDKIEETEDSFVIGAMVTLGQLEHHEGFRQMTRSVFTNGVHDIIGTQFRNLATVGGSAYARMGFSDIVTSLLPLDTYVEFTGAGTMRFADFVNGGAARDVLERIVVKKHDYRASFQCLRNSATDFSTLNACAALWDGQWHLAVGARPKKAKFLEGEDLGLPARFSPEELDAACLRARDLNYGTDRRASAAYRAELAEVLAAPSWKPRPSKTSPPRSGLPRRRPSPRGFPPDEDQLHAQRASGHRGRPRRPDALLLLPRARPQVRQVRLRDQLLRPVHRMDGRRAGALLLRPHGPRRRPQRHHARGRGRRAPGVCPLHGRGGRRAVRLLLPRPRDGRPGARPQVSRRRRRDHPPLPLRQPVPLLRLRQPDARHPPLPGPPQKPRRQHPPRAPRPPRRPRPRSRPRARA